MIFKFKYLFFLLLAFTVFAAKYSAATEFSDYTFLIAEGNSSNLNNQRFWNYLQSNNFSGIELNLEENRSNVSVSGGNYTFSGFLLQLQELISNDTSKILPVFLNYDGDILVLDSIINSSSVSGSIFYLPQGEAWPSLEYLIQSNRRIIFFVNGNYQNESRIIHNVKNYVLQVSAAAKATNTETPKSTKEISHELMLVNNFNMLPAPNKLSRDMVPDYINFLLSSWTKFGKRPNFIFVGDDIYNFDFLIEQLKSFTWINGIVKVSEKTMEKVYWRNPEVSVTGGKFSFPYRGGEEITLSPFVPGYRMVPEHIVVTGEMDIPESYTIIALPLQLSDGITGSFNFEGIILNDADPPMVFNGENFSFTQDIERGLVLKLPENASVNLGTPENYGFRNSSFTVSCFVKFNEILEFGDNAVLGNYESGYRRGLHLILRSGHPYFGLWANDFVSDVQLKSNIWYHLVWRYILETGEQAIYLDGRSIGSSDGHPPFSGTGDIHLGSALSQGASLRGYIDNLYIWDRPLGNEEINRLALDEKVTLVKKEEKISLFQQFSVKILMAILVLIILITAFIVLARKIKFGRKTVVVPVPKSDAENQVQLFGKFKAIDKEGNDITVLFTPKVKELFLFVLLNSVKSATGAPISDIDEQLWTGLPPKKIANNRAVTLNKLRKVLNRIEGIEIVTQNSFLIAKIEELFFCDYVEAFKLCQVPGGMSRQQLEIFFALVKKGRFLKNTNWPWLDETRGFTGNQVIDNLLKLASFYKNENKYQEIDALAKRILEYDDLNEEAIYLEIWTLQKTNNLRLAKFNFESFRTKYRETLNEEYPMRFDDFTLHYSKLL